MEKKPSGLFWAHAPKIRWVKPRFFGGSLPGYQVAWLSTRAAFTGVVAALGSWIGVHPWPGRKFLVTLMKTESGADGRLMTLPFA